MAPPAGCPPSGPTVGRSLFGPRGWALPNRCGHGSCWGRPGYVVGKGSHGPVPARRRRRRIAPDGPVRPAHGVRPLALPHGDAPRPLGGHRGGVLLGGGGRRPLELRL